MKILVVEDEIQLLKSIDSFLSAEKYAIEWATDYQTAAEKALLYDYDCILLDLNLPDGNGINLLGELKTENRSTNIIIISARNSLDDKIAGLNWGADDYLTKPFHLAELHARIKAVLRRKQQKGQTFLIIGNTKIEFFNRQVLIDEQPLDLSRKEFDILSFLCNNPNKLIIRENLAEYVWGGEHIEIASNLDFIYSQIRNLRQKLQAAQSNIEIKNIYGTGYKLIIK